MVIAQFIAFTLISNMAAAAANLKAVGYFRFCIFDFGRKSQNHHLSNFIGIGRKLSELLQSAFFHDGGCRHLGFYDR
jgi:hypothetical protein